MKRIALGVAGLWILACSGLAPTQHALDAADHAVLVEAAEVAAFFEGVEVDPSAEVWSKSYSLGSWDVEYTYEVEGFYVSTMVMVHESASDASTGMWAASTGMDIGAMGEDVAFVESPDLFTGGDERRCGVLMNGELAAGNYCLVRTGLVVTLFVLAGGAFEGPGELDPVLGPAVAATQGYTPTKSPLP